MKRSPLDALQCREDLALCLPLGGAKAVGGIDQGLAEVEDDRLHHRPSGCSPLPFRNLITTQAKRNLSSRSGIGGVRSAT